MSPQSPSPTGPLAGVRVLDLTSVIMGPLATQVLGDQGADVITIERHGTATARVMGAGPHPDLSGVALNLLRNKRNVVVDLQRPAGRDLALRLAATCDVFVTNLRPGPLGRLGLGYADVAAVRPDVVYCRATGFPSDGPRAAEPAYDDIIQAASGMADTVRLVHGEPSFLPTLVADKVTGLVIAQAICAALFRRERTGEGQEIEIPMIDVATAFTLVEHGAGAIPAEHPVAAGYPRILSTHRRPHPTQDGWVAILPYSREHYEAFFAATGLLDDVDPAMYADGRTRIARSDVLYGYVRRATPQRTTARVAGAVPGAAHPGVGGGHARRAGRRPAGGRAPRGRPVPPDHLTRALRQRRPPACTVTPRCRAATRVRSSASSGSPTTRSTPCSPTAPSTNPTAERSGAVRRAAAADQPAWRLGTTPIGALRRKPALCRSSSLSPPQKPYSWFTRANSLQSPPTGQVRQIAAALASRGRRCSGRSPLAAKKRWVRPLHAAASIHARSSAASRIGISTPTSAIGDPSLIPTRATTPSRQFPL